MKNEKMNLQEATLKALYDQLDDSKDVDEVEGLVDNILVVTDPKVNSEEYEEVIERAQEIVEDTPEGEIPFDEEWEGQYLQTCPICGATFVTDEILEPGAICPVCTQVPEAFVMVGKVETDEQVAKENDIDTESENEEENIEGTEFTPETFGDEEIEEPEEERIEASEEIKTADNKLQENKEVKEEGFFNLYKDYRDLYGIDKYSPAELKKFINGLNDMHRISEKEYKIMTKFAGDYQALIDNCGYESKYVENKNLEEDVEILEEDRLNFKKYGIERAPDLDFSDDGNRFRGYRCNGVPISYLYSDGRYYLSIRVDYLEGLTYDEYSKLPSYKDCDKYNMCDSVDLADVADICKRIKSEYDAALKDIKDVSDDDYKVYTDKYLEKAKKEFEEAKNSIRSLEPEDLLNASEWNIKEIKRDLENIKNEIDRWSWERKSKTDQTSRRRDLGYDSEENFKKVSYWLKDLKEVVNDIALKRTESLHENKESDIRDIMKIVNESKNINNVSQEFKDFVDEYIDMYGDEVYEAEDASEVILNDYIQTTDAINYNEAINKGYKEYIENIIDNNILTESDHDESRIASIEDIRDLRTASDALQDLWDAIEGGESEYLAEYKGDIADICDNLDKILQIAKESRKNNLEESLDDEVEAFEKQLEEAGITTTNKLYFVTGTPEDCHTLEEADEYYEVLPKWDSKNYWRDRGDITEEQFELIDKNRKLAKEILKRAADNVNSYGPLD